MNSDKGFTLVEVVVALAVVAIVSTSLFQMFVTSSFVNKNAQLMDIANVVAVQQAETFKAAPKEYSPGHETSYNFYKEDGTPILPVYYDLTVIPAGAVIMVKSDLPEPTVTGSIDTSGYYPKFAGLIDLLPETTDLNVDINESYLIAVLAGATVSYQDSSNIESNIIPIKVDCPTGGHLSTINVTNHSDLEAKFYIFNKDGSTVSFQILQGESSNCYIPPSGISSDKPYILTLTVYKVNNGVVGEEMFKYSANKYTHSN